MLRTDTWDVTRVERVRVMAAEGATTREIGEELAVSRNAIIGICRRKQIVLRNSGGGRMGGRPKLPPRPRPEKVLVRFLPPPVRERPHLEPDPKMQCSFMELTSERCHYPLWGEVRPEFNELTFCGSQPKEGSSYCYLHHVDTHNKSFYNAEAGTIDIAAGSDLAKKLTKA